MVTAAQLIAVGANPGQCDIWLPAIENACNRYGIDTQPRIAAFLAQTAHESAGFKFLEENLNYSADALLTLFGKYFSGREESERYARHPEAIANRVYAGRMGNGIEETGDGWKYRGRGLIQITGRENYRLYSMASRGEAELVLDPSPVALPTDAALSAAWYWSANKLNELVDAGNFRGLTLRINGGLNGYDDRVKRWEAVKVVKVI